MTINPFIAMQDQFPLLMNLMKSKLQTVVRQNLGEFLEDLELDFKLFFFVDSGSAYIVLEKSE